MEKRSWLVTATVIAVAAMVGLGAGFTTALVGRPTGPAASGPTTSSPPPTTQITTPTNLVVPALYYADGTIHDGEREIAYRPRFQATVANLSRTDNGWVVKERFGQDGSRLVLVDSSGSTTSVGITDPHWYAVSPEGNGLALPDYDDPNVIDFVDTTDGTVTSTLATMAEKGSVVVNAVFTGVGDELLVLSHNLGSGGSTLAGYSETGAEADNYRLLPSPPGGATSRLIGADSQGTRVLLEYRLRAKLCVTVLDLNADATPLWKSCRYRPLGSAGVSPDGLSVALAASSAALGTVTELTVVSADTGAESGSVRISSGFRLIDATWADPEHLVVQGTNDAFTAETIDICSIDEGCQSAPDASPDEAAEDVAPGS